MLKLKMYCYALRDTRTNRLATINKVPRFFRNEEHALQMIKLHGLLYYEPIEVEVDVKGRIK